MGATFVLSINYKRNPVVVPVAGLALYRSILTSFYVDSQLLIEHGFTTTIQRINIQNSGSEEDKYNEIGREGFYRMHVDLFTSNI